MMARQWRAPRQDGTETTDEARQGRTPLFWAVWALATVLVIFLVVPHYAPVIAVLSLLGAWFARSR